MKTSLKLAPTVALLLTMAAPNLRSQDNVSAVARRLERLTPQGNLVQFVAASIVPPRDASKLLQSKLFHGGAEGFRIGDTPRSMIHFEGNVEITIFNRALMLHPTTHDELTKELVLTADEADYDVDTGEIQPRGRVSIKFQNLESTPK